MNTRSRHQARQIALQGLYQLDIQRAPRDVPLSESLGPLLSEGGLDAEGAAYANELIRGAWSDHARYDEMLTTAAAHWDVSRMAVVDRNILRLALYELVARPDVPARVVMDEAIEIGREFGSAETPQFVNGVLDAIWRNHPTVRIARAAEEKKS